MRAMEIFSCRPAAFLALFFIVMIGWLLHSARATETGPKQSLDLLSGPELLNFALKTNHSFDLIDFDTGARGHLRIQNGTISVQWVDFISGGVAVLNDEQICTKAENGTKRCYALFVPGPKLSAAGCAYVIQSVYEHRSVPKGCRKSVVIRFCCSVMAIAGSCRHGHKVRSVLRKGIS